MPAFSSDTHLFAPVSIYGLHPARVSPGADWLHKPGDYNEGELKGNTPIFVQPIKPNDIHYDIPPELSHVDPFKGLAASVNKGYDWDRRPDEYNKGELEGLPQVQLAKLVPNHTSSYKVDHFEAHFKLQNEIHPDQELAEAIPVAQANYQQQKMDEHLKQGEFGAYADKDDVKKATNIPIVAAPAPVAIAVAPGQPVAAGPPPLIPKTPSKPISVKVAPPSPGSTLKALKAFIKTHGLAVSAATGGLTGRTTFDIRNDIIDALKLIP